MIFDAVGNRGLRDYERILTPSGVVLLVGAGPGFEPWLGPLEGFIKARLISPFLQRRFVTVLADSNRTEDLDTLRGLIRAGRVVPIIDRSYPLQNAVAAMQYLERGRAGGR